MGTAGQNIGNVHRTWAFSEAAALCLRNNPPGQTSLVRLQTKHEKGKALTILAHQLARAASDLLKRKTACDMDMFLRTSESSAGEPEVSRDTQGNEPASRVLTVLFDCVLERQGVHLGPVSLRLTGCLDIRSGCSIDGDGRTRLAWAAPPLSLTLMGEYTGLSQPSEEDSRRAHHDFSVAEAHRNGALQSSPR